MMRGPRDMKREEELATATQFSGSGGPHGTVNLSPSRPIIHNTNNLSLSSLLPPTMSDSLQASPRPSLFPTPSRDPPGPPSSRSVATLLASRGNGATPIPRSLQEKMVAVCTLPFSFVYYALTSTLALSPYRWLSGCHKRPTLTVLPLHSSASALAPLLHNCGRPRVARGHTVQLGWPLVVTSHYLN